MHEIMEVTETVIFSSCREYHDFCQTLKHYDFPCFVILQEYLHEYLFFIEYKLQFIVQFWHKKINWYKFSGAHMLCYLLNTQHSACFVTMTS